MPDVVSCVLVWDNKILILKRSNKVGTYRQLWGGITGFVESDESPEETAYKEIREEVGIGREQLVLKVAGRVIEFSDSYGGKEYFWRVHPFVFLLKSKQPIMLDWEHEAFVWIDPDEIDGYDTVPRFSDMIQILF